MCDLTLRLRSASGRKDLRQRFFAFEGTAPLTVLFFKKVAIDFAFSLYPTVCRVQLLQKRFGLFHLRNRHHDLEFSSAAQRGTSIAADGERSPFHRSPVISVPGIYERMEPSFFKAGAEIFGHCRIVDAANADHVLDDFIGTVFLTEKPAVGGLTAIAAPRKGTENANPRGIV